jgi:hypothetical protein
MLAHVASSELARPFIATMRRGSMGVLASRGLRDGLFLCACGVIGACGSRTGLLAEPPSDAAEPPSDAGVPLPDAHAAADASTQESGPRDAGPDTAIADAREEDAPPCNLGRVTGDVFGKTVDFANGATIAPGRYRVRYVDGCMKYSAAQDWSVNAYALGDPAGSDHWWFVSAGQQVTSVIPPGTVGFRVGQGGYATFDECVQANLALPPVELTLSSGPFGLWLEDNPYGDNVAGSNGRSPTWELECVP